MAWLNSLLIVVQVICAISIIVLILLQHGKGADMGAAFGGGASGSLFGSTGSANFLSPTTAPAATIFFLTDLCLTWFSAARTVTKGVLGTPTATPATSTAPPTPAPRT